jgi:hypothetical protein
MINLSNQFGGRQIMATFNYRGLSEQLNPFKALKLSYVLESAGCEVVVVQSGDRIIYNVFED